MGLKNSTGFNYLPRTEKTSLDRNKTSVQDPVDTLQETVSRVLTQVLYSGQLNKLTDSRQRLATIM